MDDPVTIAQHRMIEALAERLGQKQPDMDRMTREDAREWIRQAKERLYPPRAK